MALGQIYQPKKWISIHHGKVELSENGQKQLFSYVEGRLLAIYTKVRTYGGENVQKWFIDLQDESGDHYSISFPYNSGTFKSIILALASDETLNSSSVVRIEPYQKGNFTNVVVWADGVKLDWIVRELPPVEEVTINGRTYKDEAKRNELIASFVEAINGRVKPSKIVI
jgi:hypothetical protein